MIGGFAVVAASFLGTGMSVSIGRTTKKSVIFVAELDIGP